MQTVLPPRAQQYAYLPSPDEPKRVGGSALRRSVRGPALAGICIVLLLIGGFGLWGSTAPLAGGAVAPGVISPDGSRKTIQHLEGGIIGTILVRDGDTVAAGAPLLTLEDTQARALYDMLMSQYLALAATHARLTAEQLGREAIIFPPEVIKASSTAEVKDIMEVQRHLFETRRAALVSRKRVLEQRVRQLRQQIRGYEAQRASTGRRLKIVEEELEAKELLFRKGIMPKPQVLALRREQAGIQGDRGEYEANIARTQQQIGETELALVALDAERADEIAQELDRVRGDMAKLKDQLRAAADKLERTVITSPVSGTVVNLRFKTRGGVIQPGAPILDIVPADDDLLIDARVAPIDIDIVHPGMTALVHLLSYSQRRLPQIEGKVLSVSADSLRDDQTGVSYYLARVEVNRQNLVKWGKDVQLVPGMPAEVLLVTGERTLFEYLLQPFRDLFRRSLHET